MKTSPKTTPGTAIRKVTQPNAIRNLNVRRVALAAQQFKDEQTRNPKAKLFGTYSEAYSGEIA